MIRSLSVIRPLSIVLGRVTLGLAGAVWMIACAAQPDAPPVEAEVTTGEETGSVRLGRETRQILPPDEDGRLETTIEIHDGHLVLAFGWQAENEATDLEAATVRTTLRLADGSSHPLAEVRLPKDGAKEGWTETLVEVPPSLAGRAGKITVEIDGDPSWRFFTAIPEMIGHRGERPDIILVSIDTLRGDRLGCYGYDRPTSPTIDAMAAEGTLFRNALAQSSWTLPSHYSMMTALYPSAHGVNPDRWQFTGIHDTDPTFRIRGSGREQMLAERLRDAGYFTAAITESGWVSPTYGFDQGFASYVDHGDDNLAEATQKMTVDWLQAHREVPYFLFVHTYQTHLPYHQPPPYDTMFIDEDHTGYALPGVKLPWSIIDLFKNGSFPATAGDVAAFSGLYDGEIRYTDDFIRAILTELRESGRDRQTIILFTSDHGEEIFERGRLDHGATLYDEVMRVPFILWGPGHIPAAGTLETPVASVDILPTLVELATGEPPPADDLLQGRSLVPLLSGGDLGDRPLFAEGYSNESVILTSIWDGRHKAIFHGGDLSSAELYDLEKDPTESVDLSPSSPTEIDRLRGLITAWQAENAEILGLLGQAEGALDEESAERLRALGYL